MMADIVIPRGLRQVLILCNVLDLTVGLENCWILGSEWMMRLACYDTTYLVNLVNIRGHAAPVSNLGGTPLLLVDLCLQKIHIITVR
jgi:hypothetical protein